MGQAIDPATAGFIRKSTERVRQCSAAAATIKSLASVSENEIIRLRDFIDATVHDREIAKLTDWLDMMELVQLITEKAEIIAHEAEAVELASYAIEAAAAA